MILIPSGRTVLAETAQAAARVAKGENLEGIRFAILDYASDNQFGPNTVDLTLGRWLAYDPTRVMLAKRKNSTITDMWRPMTHHDGGIKELDYIDLADTDVMVHPGVVVFPVTRERIFCGEADGVGWLGKLHDTSTFVRHGGSSHANAGLIDRGFFNHITLEATPIANVPLPLAYGDVCCQISFHACEIGDPYPRNGNPYQYQTGKAPMPKPRKRYV